MDTSRPHFSKEKHVFLSVSDECDKNCKYCYLPITRRVRRTRLSNSLLFEALKMFRAGGVSLLTLSGGEPSCLADFFKITEEIVKLGMELIVQTNGALSDEQLIHLHDIGVRFVSISMDSPNEDINDKYRFLGSFKQANHCISSATSLGIPVRISTVVGTHNLQDIPNLIAYADDLGVCVLNLHRFENSSRSRELAHLETTPSEWLCSWLCWIRLASRARVFVRAPICFVTKEVASKLHSRNVSCPPQLFDTFNLSPDGNVYRCPLLVVTGDLAWNIKSDNIFNKPPKDLHLIEKKYCQKGACPILFDELNNSEYSLVPICPIVKTTLNPVGGAVNAGWDAIVMEMLNSEFIW
jgi:MoaA/NifB/PqqE/SkfB family radical SAM enzyme